MSALSPFANAPSFPAQDEPHPPISLPHFNGFFQSRYDFLGVGLRFIECRDRFYFIQNDVHLNEVCLLGKGVIILESGSLTITRSLLLAPLFIISGGRFTSYSSTFYALINVETSEN